MTMQPLVVDTQDIHEDNKGTDKSVAVAVAGSSAVGRRRWAVWDCMGTRTVAVAVVAVGEASHAERRWAGKLTRCQGRMFGGTYVDVVGMQVSGNTRAWDTRDNVEAPLGAYWGRRRTWVADGTH